MPRGTLFHRPTRSPILPSSKVNKNKSNNNTMDVSKTRRGYSNLFSSKIFALVSLLFVLAILQFTRTASNTTIHGQEKTWHGGHPAQIRGGSCWCGNEDGYCMCTPALSVDIVLYEKRHQDEGGSGYHVWAVKRRDTGQFATIGG